MTQPLKTPVSALRSMTGFARASGEGEGLTCTDDGAVYDYTSDGYRHFR